MNELKDAADFAKGLKDVGRSVVAHQLTALETMTVEPGKCPAQEGNRSELLLFEQYIDVGKPSGGINGHVA